MGDQPGCACALRVEHVVTLSDVDGRAGLSRHLVIERVPGGHYLVVPVRRQDAVLVFDSAGRFLRNAGRSGAGPGEFASVQAIRRGRGDTTVVMDSGNGRLAYLDAELRTVRTANLPVLGGWFGVLGDGRVVVMTGFGMRRSEPLDRLRLLSPTLEPIRSFMQVGPSRPESDVADLRRRMAVSPDGIIALGHNNRYVVEIWDASGTHLRTLSRDPDWFAPPSPGRPGGGAAEPAPRLETPRFDGRGRLWTLSHVADANWRDALAPTKDVYGREVVTVRTGRQSDHLDTIVEVLDPKTGRLLAGLRIDAAVDLISDDGFAASYREDEVGQPSIDIWRFTLVGD
ncbi:MAG TPA: 6-bladed beta-propeller [Longimicrobiaceae bacterium]